MHRQFILLIFFLWGILFFHTLIVQAHQLSTDGSISALLHVEPNDDPVIGQPTNLLFLITDTKSKFTPENCNCVVSIKDTVDNKKIFSFSISKKESSYKGTFAPVISFTFPHKGIYTIKLDGEATKDLDFQSFNLSYNIRADKDSLNTAVPTKENFSFYKTIILILEKIKAMLHILLFSLSKLKL